MGMTTHDEETEFDVEDVIRLMRAHLNKGRASLAEMLGGHSEVASEGCYVYGHAGRRYLECGRYGAFILGPRHPAVTAGVVRQGTATPRGTRELLEPGVTRGGPSPPAHRSPGTDL